MLFSFPFLSFESNIKKNSNSNELIQLINVFRMKKILTILLFTLFSSNLFAQSQITVKSFRKLESDMTARYEAPKKDQNGDVCAVIKVVTTQTGFNWDSDGLGIIAAIPKVSEY